MDCYLLVGGLSRRMGLSKTSLFFPRLSAVASAVFPRVLAVQRRGEPPLPIETVYEEPHEGSAPVFGVLAALRHARGRCFILAVDYPLLTAEVLAFVRDAGGVPVWRGKPQLLCASYDPALVPAIERRLGEGRLDLRGLIEEAGAAMIAESELRARFAGEPLMNVNTPQELEEAERIHGERFLASR